VLTRKTNRTRDIEKWGIFELALKGPRTGNPFVDVTLVGEFRKDGRILRPEGFYDDDGIYRIRFMPDEEGVWHYRTRSNCRPLSGKVGSFTCVAPRPGNHGPVRVRNKYHFEYADGKSYWPIGTTCYGWVFKTLSKQKQTMASLRKSPFNKMRMIVLPFAGSRAKKFPFPGYGSGTWDFSRFSPDFFRYYEQRIGQLLALGVEADLILFHPYDKGRFGFDTMRHDVNIRFIRYCVARFGAYRNVWWSLANEFDFVRTRKMSEWDSFGRTIIKCDPYRKLCSIHNGAQMYNNRQPWITHASIQNGSAVADFGRAGIYRECFGKPVIYDEVCYEGNHTHRWGQLSGEEMTHRCWQGYIAGTYVGHSESWKKGIERDSSWLGAGGALEGKSWRRIAFLRRLMEEGPAEGIGLAEGAGMLSQHYPSIAGVRGKYYVVYFGWNRPREWKVVLPKGVTDGARCRVDLVDTWNMKVTPLKGEMVLRQRGHDDFVQTEGDIVRLPGRSFMALRIWIRNQE
jgi:hypothetical protein